jgi:hypothetical protein
MGHLDASRWWDEDVEREERAGLLVEYVRGLERALEPDYFLRARRYAYLYDRNARLMGMNGRPEAPPSGDPATENIIRSNIETAAALLGNEGLRVAALTDGAEWSVQRRAKRLERFLEAMFQRVGWDEKQVRAVRSAGVAGNGYTKFEIEDGEIVANHVPFDEIIVDEIACRAGPPRSLAHRRFVNRDVLIAHFPDARTAIERAHRNDPNWTQSRRLQGSQVALIEAWHLPSKKGATDGRRVLAIEGATLADEPYKRSYFPFVIFRWVERLTGFYGCGLAEELAGYQLAVNKVNRMIRGNMSLYGNQRMFAHHSDAQTGLQLDDEEGGIYYYKQKVPVVPDWPALKPDVYQYRESLKTDAQRYSGIPDMAARSMKPVGLDSGAALREWTDIQASRLTTQKAAIERMRIEAARHLIDLAKELHGRGQNVKAFWNSRNLAKKIDWSEVDMSEDMYVLRVEPASAMSRTPAGMRQLVTELAQTGAVKPEEILRLLGIPDVQRTLDIATAPLEDIEAEIEDLYDEIWRAPEPFMDLVHGIPRMQSAYLLARRGGAPAKVLDLLQRWMVLAKRLQDQAMAPAAPQMAAVPFQAGVAAPAGAVAPAAPAAPPGPPAAVAA